MAHEAKRGCGYRKVGGLYMVGGGVGIPCDRLPFELTVCTCCGQGIKQARGWTWVDVAKFFNGPHVTDKVLGHTNADNGGVSNVYEPCRDTLSKMYCPLCEHPESMGRAGLLWVGEKFYKTPADFVKEGVNLGFSRRIKAIPQGFKVGETWVLLAHSKSITGSVPELDPNTGVETGKRITVYKPGIFYVWLPQRVELILNESQRGSDEAKAAEKRGITPVYFPDGDPDHQGNVHDDFERDKKAAKSEEVTEAEVGF
jgi:hypothetical protein